jgi:hypothetical protein
MRVLSGRLSSLGTTVLVGLGVAVVIVLAPPGATPATACSA